MSNFSSPTAQPVYYRTYSRLTASSQRENWLQTTQRNIDGLIRLGKLTPTEADLILEQQIGLTAMNSGRWLWIGGTDWIDNPYNYSGAYNCSAWQITSFSRMAFCMGLLMQGCGVGTLIETDCIDQLPPILAPINLVLVGDPGDYAGQENTTYRLKKSLLVEQAVDPNLHCDLEISIGDSRQGWIDAYQAILEIAKTPLPEGSTEFVVEVKLGGIRASGSKIKGFGGVSNPDGMKRMFRQMVKILNKAVGRQLNSLEVSLLMDEAGLLVVAGNVRRSANIRQGSADDEIFRTAKDNLWQQDANGNWRIDPDRDALRMGNHTRVFHQKPTLDECVAAVSQQFHSGEGAIAWAGEAIARANADLLCDSYRKSLFIQKYQESKQAAGDYLISLAGQMHKQIDSKELAHRLKRYLLNPCFAAGTMVRTSDGDVPIEELVGKEAHIWNGQGWQIVDNFRVTGTDRPVFKIVLGSGQTITATAEHSFILENYSRKQLSELQVGDALMPCHVRLSGEVAEIRYSGWHHVQAIEPAGIADKVYCCTVEGSHAFALSVGILVGNCGEIIMNDNMCNLAEVHLNRIDPLNFEAQRKAYQACALSVSCLLNHQFVDADQQYSRQVDPIVGVSFTGLFDFFVAAFGVDWLRWWEAGRPPKYQISELGQQQVSAVARCLSIAGLNPTSERGGAIYRRLEAAYFAAWRQVVEETVEYYCDKHDLPVPNRCTTVQPGGCLDRTALRIFDQGLLYADEIVAEGSGETVGLDLSVRSGIAVNTAIANEPLNLVKVTLRNGRQLRMTPNHRMSVQGRWVEATSLKPGMVIDYQMGCYQKNDDVKLVSLDADSCTREVRLAESGSLRGVISRTIPTPSQMSPVLGYFLGALFGNGRLSESRYQIQFSHEHKDVLNRLSGIGASLFGMQGRIRADGGHFELCFASKQLFDWLWRNNLAKTARNKDSDRIPESIRRSSRQTLLSFFCGLIDTDGCSRSNGALSIKSASESFVRNLQQVGEAIGLSFSISHNTQGSNYESTKSIWSLSLSRTKSTPEAIVYVNQYSTKAQLRPIPCSVQTNGGELCAIVSVEPEVIPDYSYDFAVEGIDDDDAWYWQGCLKSHNTKSLLTGASAGWHPPKAQQYIRRMTFRREDPVALACIDYGYNVIPSQTDKDEQGNLLDDPYDPRCTEWLVEIPVSVPWATLPGAEAISINEFSALAQFDFYMGIQSEYTGHNTSATIELREEEIEPLARRIHQAIANDEGYISAALLARFDAASSSYPRLPFEPITLERYQELSAAVLERRVSDDFGSLLSVYDLGDQLEAGPAGCDSDKCLIGALPVQIPVELGTPALEPVSS